MWQIRADGPVDRYRRAIASLRMGYVDERDVDAVRRRSKREIEESIATSRLALREIEEIRQHACKWDAEDRCGTCGADGRA